MRQRGPVVGRDEATDAALAARAGTGDLAAFEELYRRHCEAAWRVALAVTANPDDAADAVSDAFTRVFQALPDKLHAADSFLPYLLAAVRNAGIDVLRRGTRQRPSDPHDAQDWPVLGPEPAELLIAGTDAALIARAFRSLPERWRSVLWLTEVEGIPARDVAVLLGVSANGVAQLAVRARAGLRQRYLQAHLRQTEVRILCRDTVGRLGAYAAGALAPRDIAKVDQHLAGCQTCRSRLDQLEDLAPSLRHAALPLPAGLAAVALGRWQLSSSGASGTSAASGTSTASGATASTEASSATVAGAAGPAGIGLGTTAVAVPTSFATSVASLALIVAGIVGAGVVEHRLNDRDRSTAPVAAAQAGSFQTAADPAGSPGDPPAPTILADDPLAGLVDESGRRAADLAVLTEDFAASLPAGLPAVAPPDPAGVEGIAPGGLSPDLNTLPITAEPIDGDPSCPALRVLGVQVGCQLLATDPLQVPEPAAEAGAAAAAAEEAAARADATAVEAADAVVSRAVQALEE